MEEEIDRFINEVIQAVDSDLDELSKQLDEAVDEIKGR